MTEQSSTYDELMHEIEEPVWESTTGNGVADVVWLKVMQVIDDTLEDVEWKLERQADRSLA